MQIVENEEEIFLNIKGNQICQQNGQLIVHQSKVVPNSERSQPQILAQGARLKVCLPAEKKQSVTSFMQGSQRDNNQQNAVVQSDVSFLDSKRFDVVPEKRKSLGLSLFGDIPPNPSQQKPNSERQPLPYFDLINKKDKSQSPSNNQARH